jgi:UDP-N-acetylglucosamine 4,6-dehydratase
MTRFWITLEQGVRFVINCIELMNGGEVFIPKIPSMRLVDIAASIAPGARWKAVGIRSGEKLHEELVTREEAPRTKEFDVYYIVEPEHPFWNTDNHPDGRPVGEGFQYGSDTNAHWLKPEELRACLADLQIDFG